MVLILLRAFPVGAADTTVVLELRNGDRLSGLVLSDNTNRIILSNAWAGELIVPAGQIVKRTPQPAKAPAVAKPEGPEPAVTASQYGILVSPRVPPAPVKHWTVEGEVGAGLQHSTKALEVFYGRAKYTYARQPLRAVLDYVANYGHTDGEVNANNMAGSGKLDFDIGKRWFFYNMAGVGYDRIRRIDLDFEEGPGIGYHLIQRDALKANLELGFNYYAEYRQDETDQSTFSTRFAENATWLLNKRLSVEQRLEFFPRVNDLAEFRVRFEGTLRFWLTTHLTLNVSLFDLFDTHPAVGVPENDLQMRSSIGFRY